MNNCLDENNMLYYPTPKMVYIAPPSPMHTAAGPRLNGGFTQTTLAWNTAGRDHHHHPCPNTRTRGQRDTEVTTEMDLLLLPIPCLVHPSPR